MARIMAECVLYIVQRPADEIPQTAVVCWSQVANEKKVFWPENFHEINLKTGPHME